jgi:hypothetical protein
MEERVVRMVRTDHQVLRPVVEPILVDVMDLGFGRKLFAEGSLRDFDVLSHIVAADGADLIALRVYPAVALAVPNPGGVRQSSSHVGASIVARAEPPRPCRAFAAGSGANTRHFRMCPISARARW